MPTVDKSSSKNKIARVPSPFKANKEMMLGKEEGSIVLVTIYHLEKCSGVRTAKVTKSG